MRWSPTALWRSPKSGERLSRRKRGAGVTALEGAGVKGVRGEIEQLRGAMRSLEAQFLETGAALVDLSGNGRTLVSNSARLVEIASGSREGAEILGQATRMIDVPLSFFPKYIEDSERLLGRLEADLAKVDECLRGDVRLRRAMTPLRAVRTMFKVVSAPLGGEVQRMFESLTDELAQLHEQVEELFSTKFAELRQVRGTLVRVVQSMRAERSRWDAIAAVRADIERSTERLRSQLAANAARESQVNGMTSGIAESIERVVTGIQWQDIINQKLDHVVAGVEEMVGFMEAGESRRGSAGRSARLQGAHLAEARRELENAERSIVDGVEQVLGELEESEASDVMLREFETITTSYGGMVQQLLDVTATIGGQTAAVLAFTQVSLRELEGVGNIAAGMIAAVRDVSERTQLIGLNAQVRSAKMPHGAGLGVVSARTSEVSVDVTRIGREVAAALGEIATDLSECVLALGGMYTDVRTQEEQFSRDRAPVETRLHALRDEALNLVRSTGQTCEAIGANGRRARSSVRYTATASTSMGALLATLNAAAEEFKDAVDEAGESAPDARVYTMASERRVHASVFGGAGAGDEPEAGAGVELFGSAGSASASAAALNNSVGRVRTSVDSSMQKSTASAAAVSATAAASKELDSGVELF